MWPISFNQHSINVTPMQGSRRNDNGLQKFKLLSLNRAEFIPIARPANNKARQILK